ncbi:YbhB/YbcL family Raf kinase inhibitor-like protein [Candidatus Woesearchaeota archaeon]|nr:YbhB/YbcL family Raf kinase inhibitor-like protein [Candidatus Woesearchaeota archaeon]
MRYILLLLFLSACTTGSFMSDDLTPVELTSPAVQNYGDLPAEYTCDGADVSPGLRISNYPSDAKSFAIEMFDFDAPQGEFNHWYVWNIPPTEDIEKGSKVGVQGLNGFGKLGYGGPCPPVGERHRYRIKLFMLDKMLATDTTTANMDERIDGHVVHETELDFRYKRQ